MKIERIINNNIVTSKQNGNEVVIMGKGVGFNQTVGADVVDSKIEKIFSLENEVTTDRFKSLLIDIPMEEIQTVDEIVSYAKLSLAKKISDSIYISLTDHIHFAIERFNKGIEFKNPLAWEVRHFYHHEYLIGKEALEIISRRLNVTLPFDETITIALHIVNAEMDSTMDGTVGMTKIIKQILSIIQYSFNTEFSETSLSYERMLTHLKFFVQRITMNRPLPNDNIELFSLIRHSYPKEYECALKINNYVLEETGHKLTTAELAYITIHIHRVVNNI
ncbi:BglG family transcription antiterminator LicT [Enterococcus gallinarum]|uniref:BglG family transcription antiterminator LicT n=1 Tax=Enterococcus gallinarum TaxID=1353 RepID=UPI002DBC3A08|nr:PRD domain-containing protein [Enterococcus gallinarum]MEB5970146.1 PRD domain-containing protein [Enterococcus gallinarum]